MYFLFLEDVPDLCAAASGLADYLERHEVFGAFVSGKIDACCAASSKEFQDIEIRHTPAGGRGSRRLERSRRGGKGIVRKLGECDIITIMLLFEGRESASDDGKREYS